MAEVSYATALRCIGQDLERRGLQTFEILRERSHFIVLCADQELPAARPEALQYTPADIEILDRSGEGQRSKNSAREFLNQGQMLRAIGDYLDKYGSTLIRISKSNVESEEPFFRVEYISREGENVIDDRPGAAIFDMCVLMYQKRRVLSGAPGGSWPGGRH